MTPTRELRQCIDCGADLVDEQGQPRHGLAVRCNSGACYRAYVMEQGRRARAARGPAARTSTREKHGVS